jgi:hypothetical protein
VEFEPEKRKKERKKWWIRTFVSRQHRKNKTAGEQVGFSAERKNEEN